MSAQKIAKFSVEPRDYTEARQSTPEVRRIVPEIRGLHDGEDGHEGEDGHDVSCPYKGRMREVRRGGKKQNGRPELKRDARFVFL